MPGDTPVAAGGRSACAATSLGTIVGAVLAPKCPLCVAFALSSLGLGATLARRIAPFVRPGGFLLAVVVILGVAWAEWRRFAKRRRGSVDAKRSCCAR